jgi:hypothetical protein
MHILPRLPPLAQLSSARPSGLAELPEGSRGHDAKHRPGVLGAEPPTGALARAAQASLGAREPSREGGSNPLPFEAPFSAQEEGKGDEGSGVAGRGGEGSGTPPPLTPQLRRPPQGDWRGLFRGPKAQKSFLDTTGIPQEVQYTTRFFQIVWFRKRCDRMS